MRLLTYIMVSLLSLFGINTAARAAQDVYGLSFKTIDGQDLPLSTYKGKVVLIVNTASQCGFTPQYAGLEALYEKYKDKGFVVLAVPSNDFGGQEPGSAQDIKKFTSEKFHVTFPVAGKEKVTGADAHPFYSN